jgi:hypothetical protein
VTSAGPDASENAWTERVEELDDILGDVVGFKLDREEIGSCRDEHIAAAMTDADWDRFNTFWRTRSPEWKQCFATLLGDLSTARAEAWLLELIETESDELALVAVESYRSQRGRTPISASAADRIRALWRKHTRFTIRQIDELVADMTR